MSVHPSSVIIGNSVTGERPTPRWRTEPELRAAIAATLRAHGIALAEKIPCAAGEADIVTTRRDLVIECKLHLTRKNLYTAVGQVLIYRQTINPAARAVIVGYMTPETAALMPHIASLGIEIVCWSDRDWGMVDGDRGSGTGEETHDPAPITAVQSTDNSPSPTPDEQTPALVSQSPTPNPQSLRWNVATLARAKGFKNVPALAWRMGVQRQGIYAFWNGTARQVSLDILERLSHVLEAEIGDWFVWARPRAVSQELRAEKHPAALSSQHPALAWNVRSRMEALGLDPTRLASVPSCIASQLCQSLRGSRRR
jgi:DNA-binding Xre family transcriptional regulator